MDFTASFISDLLRDFKNSKAGIMLGIAARHTSVRQPLKKGFSLGLSSSHSSSKRNPLYPRSPLARSQARIHYYVTSAIWKLVFILERV